jgi:glycosyltransferase involved in cell wall biosynthesis
MEGGLSKRDTGGISIIIPLFNKERTIRETLTRLLDVAPFPNEIIVVDDGSTDSSYAIANEFIGKITLHRQENAGPSVARNQGARLAKNSHLIFLDADDYLLPGVCQEHLRLRDKFPKASLTCVSFEVKDLTSDNTERQILADRTERTKELIEFIVESLDFRFIENIAAGSFCVDRDVFLRAGGFDESLRIWEITDAMIRFRLETKYQAISAKVLCRINRDSHNSQFNRTVNNNEQYTYYSRKLLQYSESFTEQDKFRVAQEVVFCLNRLWVARSFQRMSALMDEALKLLGPAYFKDVSTKVKLTSKALSFLCAKGKSLDAKS